MRVRVRVRVRGVVVHGVVVDSVQVEVGGVGLAEAERVVGRGQVRAEPVAYRQPYAVTRRRPEHLW